MRITTSCKLRLAALAALALFATPALKAAVNIIAHTVEYDYSGLSIGTDTLGGATYTTLTLGELLNGGTPGAPSLPIDYIRFSVPYNATGFTVTPISMYPSNSKLNYPIYPCQTPFIPDGSGSHEVTLPDSAIYSSSSQYPSPRAEVVDEGFLDGENHIVTVAVTPITCYKMGRGYFISKPQRVTVNLRYTLGDTLAMAPIVRNDSLLREEGYELTRGKVVNPDQVKSFAPGAGYVHIDSMAVNIQGLTVGADGLNGGLLPDSLTLRRDTISAGYGEIITNGNYPYLIITTSALKHSVRRLAALKRQKGYNVRVVTLDDVYASPCSRRGDVVNGIVRFNDSAGKLRQFIKYYYTYLGTKYVLLAGSEIPYRSVDSLKVKHETISGHGDLYYCDLNGNWIDDLDIEPEVFVGRLPAKNSEQVDAYVDKLLRYELNPGHGDYSYLKKGLFTEGQDFLSGFNILKSDLSNIYPNPISISEIPNGDYPKGNDILDSINVCHPASIWSFNHGAASCIRAYGPDSSYRRHFLWAVDTAKVLFGIKDTLETGNGLNRMNNKNYPMIYYSLCCKTMPFNKITGAEVDLNYGESFVLGKDYGGPVYIGYVEDVHPENVSALANKFVKRIKLSSIYTLGEAYAWSKSDYKGGDFAHMAVYHNYFGDPALRMWTRVPLQYKNLQFSNTDSTVNVAGVNVIPSYVSYTNNLGQNVCQKVNAAISISNVSLNHPFLVYSNIAIPYICPLKIQNANISKSEYIYANDVSAGYSVDSSRTSGDVVVKSGVEYEIESAGTVTLEDGFEVQKGATFAVYPSSY